MCDILEDALDAFMINKIDKNHEMWCKINVCKYLCDNVKSDKKS